MANKPRKKKQSTKASHRSSPPLAWQQFQELNFSFYEEHPYDFINMRIEVLSLMLCNEEQLTPVYAAERTLKGISLGGTTPPDKKKRDRYLQTEAVVILHHAAEMLLRLFYAHVDYPDCPWQGMASLVSFSEFKQKVEGSLEAGFDRAQIAEIFLGGSSPEDACVAMSTEQFEDAVDGMDLLLSECAKRILSESFLYNSIKHGLSTIALDESTQIGNQPDGGELVVAHTGPMLAYMHRQRRPGQKASGEREWFMSMAGAKPERDLGLSILVARAVESLWDVARRKYTGKGGNIRYIKRSSVELVIYGLLEESKNILNTLSMEMPKLRSDGSYSGIEYDFIMNYLPEDYERSEGEHSVDCPRVKLPVRQRDKRVFSTSKRRFYPFSPPGSQSV